uniref:Amine oxidase n=1 Tax=Athene cunicularia TaxID=194338 RepID=A0A663MLC3_ATHCN
MFHGSGAVEVRVHATGYISSSFFHGRGTNYGNRVGPHTLGTMHLHHIHYKVDLDVNGQVNSLETQDMGYELAKEPWSMQNTIERPYLRRERLEREDEAAFPLNAPMPRYLCFASPFPNKWGHPRSYRIQITSFAGEHLPASSPMERSISWGRYQLAVTRRKEEEPTSTSIYNQNDPWTPTVAFADFINNETITNEVSWGPGAGGCWALRVPPGSCLLPSHSQTGRLLGQNGSAQPDGARLPSCPGPGGLDLRGVPACAPRRGRPQHGDRGERRRLFPEALQLLRRGSLSGFA